MLLTKAELNLAQLADDVTTRYTLAGIAIEPKSTVVTNGHYLVTVEHGELSEENFPATPGLEHKKLENGAAVSERVMVSRESALAASKALPRKSTIPILLNAALGKDNSLYVNSLHSVQSFKSENTGKFPEWSTIIPKEKPQAEIVLNAEYLEMLAKFIRENGNSQVTAVRLTLYGDTTSMRFDALTASGQHVMALLMPMRSDSASFAKRPHEAKKASE